MKIETSITIEPKLPDFAEAARLGVAQAAAEIHRRAIASMEHGTKTGRTYRRGSIEHQASAPGEAPARDRGRLTSSISWDSYPASLSAEIGSKGIEYGLFLEEGTDKIEPRPWLKPAADQQNVIDDFVRAFQRRAG